MRALTGATLLAAALLAGCGGYSGPQTGNIAPASIPSSTAAEAAQLYRKADACVTSGHFYADPDWSQSLITGPGFEACPGIIADLKAEYLRDKAAREAEQSAVAAQAEAADLAQRRKIIADP